MANRKKPFMRLETKEEYDKLCNTMIKCGYENGFHDGRIDALSVFINAIKSNFETEEQSDAEYQLRNAKIKKWQKEQKEREIQVKEFCNGIQTALNKMD